MALVIESRGEMNTRESYIFWRLAYSFISDHGYRIIQLFENQKELWLEKLENKKAPIIRMLLHDLDWSNAMQRDIEFTASNGERVRKQIGRNELKVINIYISQFPPVDEYEYRLAKPFINPDGNKTEVNSILLTSEDYEPGFQRLTDWLKSELTFPINDEYSVEEAENQKKATLEYAMEKVKSEKAIFTNGKPLFTYLLMLIQVAMFFWLETHGGSTNTSTLIKYGAKFNPYIYNGEWWRFLTPIFLHIGFAHLAMNTISLYFLGTMVERIFGNIRFLFIYFFAGILGFIGSFLFVDNISAGASGAIFGCAGALLYFGLMNPKLFSRTLGPAFIVIILINLFFGFSRNGIDNAGHIGGLIGGFLAAGMLHLPKQKKPLVQMAFLILSLSLVWGSLSYGFSHSAKSMDENSMLLLAQENIKQENYQQAYNELKKVEEKSDHPSTQIYFLLSFTEIKQNMLDDARIHLHKVLQLDPDFPEANYNLALIYLEQNDFVQAKKYAEKAAELNPNKKEYTNLVHEINQYLQSSGVRE